MDDKNKTKAQLIAELEELRKLKAEFEAAETERKKAEDALKESEKKYKHMSFEFESILDHLPALVFYKDKNNNFIRVNKYVADAYNLKKEELEGKNLSDLHEEDEAKAYLEDDLAVIKSGEPKLNILETWETEKGLKWVSTSKIPFRDKKGEIIGIIGISIDITEQKNAEENLKETNKNLEDLVYITSHDLQSPLVSMEGFASKLLEDYRDKLGGDGEHRLIRLKENAKNMHNLVLSLLDISRLSTEKYAYESFSPDNVIKEIVSGEFSMLIEEKNVVVKTGNLPNIFGDKKRITGVFRRLIANSIKYGGKKIIAGCKNGAYFVKDNGIGIPESQTEKIFSPGERLKVIKVEGTGMGLTFCRNVINKHNGEIWVESEGENKGSTFYFTIEKHRR